MATIGNCEGVDNWCTKKSGKLNNPEFSTAHFSDLKRLETSVKWGFTDRSSM